LAVDPRLSNAIADQQIHALGLPFKEEAPGAQIIQWALHDACMTARDQPFCIRDLPQRVDFSELRMFGVSDGDIAVLEKRLARVCSRRGTFFGEILNFIAEDAYDRRRRRASKRRHEEEERELRAMRRYMARPISSVYVVWISVRW